MNLYPKAPELLSHIEREVDRLGGTIADRICGDERLFVRALLPVGREVQRHDFIGHGLAVRIRGRQVVVHPYTFRQACSNGAIHVEHITSRCIERSESETSSFGVPDELRQALELCSQPSVFDDNLDDMQRMLAKEARISIVMASMVNRIRDADRVERIRKRYLDGKDGSLFGVMNAITSEARDEPDPEKRWQIEELGGGILAILRPPKQPRTPGHKKRLPAELRRAVSKAG